MSAGLLASMSCAPSRRPASSRSSGCTTAQAGHDVALALADGGVTALEVTMTVPER